MPLTRTVARRTFLLGAGAALGATAAPGPDPRPAAAAAAGGARRPDTPAQRAVDHHRRPAAHTLPTMRGPGSGSSGKRGPVHPGQRRGPALRPLAGLDADEHVRRTTTAARPTDPSAEFNGQGLDQDTIGTRMTRPGYTCGYFGKYMNGYERQTRRTSRPAGSGGSPASAP